MSDSDTPNGRTVVERFLAGDQAAMAEARRAAEIVVHLGGHGIPAGEREDIVQQALLETYEALLADGFELHKGLACFVRKVAQRRCLDWKRRKKDTVEVSDDLRDESTGPDGHAIRNERQLEATLVMEKLPPACRRLIEMHVVRQLPYGVIAALTGRTEVALRQEMFACIKKARRILDELRGNSRGPAGPERRGGAEVSR